MIPLIFPIDITGYYEVMIKYTENNQEFCQLNFSVTIHFKFDLLNESILIISFL